MRFLKIDQSKPTRYIIIIAGISIIIIIITFGIYFYQFNGVLSNNQQIWGVFGDYVGGILNPIFGLAAFLALLFTIIIQSRSLGIAREELEYSKNELELSRKELKNSADALRSQNETLKKQNFEHSLFQLLRFHNELVNSLDLMGKHKSEIAKQGRNCFKILYEESSKSFKQLYDNFESGNINKLPQIKIIDHTYSLFFNQNQSEIGHYFRHLYHIYKFIHASDIRDKFHYADIAAAQLSTYELLLLFYNCLSSMGKRRLKPLIEQYSIFENMNTELLLRRTVHMELYEPSAFDRGQLKT